MSSSHEQYIKYKNWDGGKFLKYTKVENAYFQKALSISGIKPKSLSDILEIGFGNGNFLGFASQHYNNVVGIEANPLLVEKATKNKISAFQSFNELNKQRFDLIVAFDVVEHLTLDELSNFFSEMAAHLADNGAIILRFPNGDSPFGRINQHGDITHKATIGRGKLKMLCEMSDLKLLKITDDLLPIFNVPLKFAIAHLLIRFFRSIFCALFGVVFYHGNFIPLGPNYFAVISARGTKHSNKRFNFF